ncbi:MAG TPA: hypothetical protein VGJ48_00735, partial [Pyrinomonadaceae bacterium]
MLDLASVYCYGYMATPIVEACQRRGLFELLDIREFRERTGLIRELKANAGYFTVALEALESLGWLEKNSDDAYRLTSKVDRYPERGLTELYAMEPEQLIRQKSHARTLSEKIEQVFLRSEVGESASPDPARGSIIVPLAVALRGTDAEDCCENLDRLDPRLSQTIIELFIQQGWLTVDKAELTPSGKALLQCLAFNVAVSYRPVLHAIGELLFGDPAHVFNERCSEKSVVTSHSLRRKNLGQEVFVEDLQREIVEIFNREPSKQQPQAIIHVHCGDGAVLDEIARIIGSRTARGRHLAHMPVRLVGVDNNWQVLKDAAKTLAGLQHHTLFGDVNEPDKLRLALEQAGVTAEQEALHLRILIDHLITVDAKQPVSAALTVLAADQPVYYVDQEGRLVDAVTVLSCWQRHLRALAHSVHDSRLLIVEAHAAPSQLIDRQSEKFDCLHCDWIHRLSHEYLIGAEAFITLAASVGLFNDDCVKRYPKTSDPCRISMHSFRKRDYIIR